MWTRGRLCGVTCLQRFPAFLRFQCPSHQIRTSHPPTVLRDAEYGLIHFRSQENPWGSICHTPSKFAPGVLDAMGISWPFSKNNAAICKSELLSILLRNSSPVDPLFSSCLTRRNEARSKSLTIKIESFPRNCRQPLYDRGRTAQWENPGPAARVKVVVASVMQPTGESACLENARWLCNRVRD